MIYLDNAATSWKKPPAVLAALRQALGPYGGNPGRASHALSLAAAEKIDETRHALAAMLALPFPSHIVFTLNATYALNMAIKGRVRQGDHILLSDREHNAVYRPVCRLVAEVVADFDVFSTVGDVRRNLNALLRRNTRMLVCNHVSNVDGARAPLAEIGAFCREHGIYFIVDISQSAGHMPLSHASLGYPNAVCAPSHKGLFGIQGCGFAWFLEEGDIAPLCEGGSGSASRSPTMPKDLPEHLEAGTLPTPAILALLAGVEFIKKITPEAIAAHEEHLADHLCDRLSAARSIRIYRPAGGGVLSLTCEGKSPDRLVAALDAEGVCVRGGLHCAPLAHAAIGTEETGTVRVSFSYMNTLHEANRFADLFLSLCK